MNYCGICGAVVKTDSKIGYTLANGVFTTMPACTACRMALKFHIANRQMDALLKKSNLLIKSETKP